MTRAVAALLGSVPAAAGAWFAAGTRPTAADRPPATVAPASASGPRTPVPPQLRLDVPSGGLADPHVRAGALELPIVDLTELLPSCHR